MTDSRTDWRFGRNEDTLDLSEPCYLDRKEPMTITEQLAHVLKLAKEALLVAYRVNVTEFQREQAFNLATNTIAPLLAAYEASKAASALSMPPNERLQGTGPIGSEPAQSQDIEELVDEALRVWTEVAGSGKGARESIRAALLAVRQKLRGGE